jgi:hypothetical protein
VRQSRVAAHQRKGEHALVVLVLSAEVLLGSLTKITHSYDTTRAPRAPLAVARCAPSVPHETVGPMRPCRACPACTSPIFVPRRSARHNAWMDGALRPTRLRARRPRAVLADSKGLWWGPRATESTRPARRCVEPSVKKYRTAQRHVAQALAISRRIIRVPASDSTGSHGFAGSRWKLGWVAHVTHTHKTPPVAQSGRGPYPHTAHTDRQTE